MTHLIYGDHNWQTLVDAHQSRTADGSPECLPRKSRYGSGLADRYGLIPMSDYPTDLVPKSDWKEYINHCRQEQMFPEFYEHNTWCPEGTRWNQNGLRYCWAWSLTAALMDKIAHMGLPVILLGPTSLGGAVGWRNEGYYLDGAIDWAKKHGITPAEFLPDMLSINYRQFKTGWEDAALNFRPTEWWDTDRGAGVDSMISQCLTILGTGTSVHIAYGWWGHALCLDGLIWDETQKYNIRWVIRNSHDEDDHIEMTGDRGVPDEGYGIRAAYVPVWASMMMRPSGIWTPLISA